MLIMKSFWCFIAGLVLGVSMMGIAYSYHFVRSGEGIVIVPKTTASLANVYVDITDWTLTEWGDHPAVMRALVEDGRSDLIKTSVADEALQNLLPSLGGKEPEVASPVNLNRQ